MFAQVIQGRTGDAAALWNRLEEWDRSLKPGVEGYLGTTAGVSDDGEFIAVARFESEEAARRNSDRPEQDEWWAETEKLLDGEVRFYDSTQVDLMLEGGSDDAGFVQVMQGRVKDKERLLEMEAQAQSWMKENRPDVVGSVRVWQGDEFSEFIYFTSEEEARAGEKKEPPSEMGSEEEWSGMMEDLKFIDVRKPFLSSP
ncbi:MAG: hypothetical protein H0T12_00115 [Actinobacteria bacterium]|nr:hypothetical protein [Actinomycetota bacterium]